MVSSNLSPRQKMINMLYVVLIAMLAINISEKVLDGFVVTKNDLEKNIDQQKMLNEKLVDGLNDKGHGDIAKNLENMMKAVTEEFSGIKNEIKGND